MYEGVDADVVLLGLAGREDTLDYVAHVVDATGAKRIVPIHWDDFFRGLDEPLRPIRAAKVDEFFATMDAQRPDLTIETLPLLQPCAVLGGIERARYAAGRPVRLLLDVDKGAVTDR